MINRDELILNTTEKKLLYGIYKTAQETNKTMQEIKSLLQKQTNGQETKPNLDNLKRSEIVALINSLPAENRPERWTTLPNVELINFLKKEGA